MVDRRVRHTKERLEEALLDLLKGKNINNITVSELCRKADITRNTFYTYYQTPNDLLRELEQRYAEKMREQVNQIYTTLDPRDFYRSMLEDALNDPLTQIIRNPQSGSTIFREMQVETSKRAIEMWAGIRNIGSDREMEWMYIFLAEGTNAIINDWIEHDPDHNPVDVVRFIEKASYGLMDYVMGFNKQK